MRRDTRWVFVALIAAAVAAQGAETAKPKRGMGQYTNKSWRWSISYPSAWTLEAKDPDLIRIRAAGESALCSIYSGPMDRFNTVDELTDFMLAHDERFFKDKNQKFVILARRRIALPNGIVGNDVLVEIGRGGRSRRVHVMADGRGFALDCEGYTSNWGRLEASYQRVLSSFTVGK